MKTYELKMIAEIIDYTEKTVDDNGEVHETPKRFLAYKGRDLKGNKCDFRFDKTCEKVGHPVPTEEGTYIVKVKSNKIYPDNRKSWNTYRIREIEDVIGFDKYIDDIENDDLPF